MSVRVRSEPDGAQIVLVVDTIRLAQPVPHVWRVVDEPARQVSSTVQRLSCACTCMQTVSYRALT